MNRIMAILKSFYFCFLRNLFPLIAIILGLIYYFFCYQKLFLDTFNLFNLLGTIVTLPLGLFVIYILLVRSYSYFNIAFNTSIFCIRSEGWNFPVYKVNQSLYVDKKNNISFGTILMGFALCLLMIPVSLIAWVVNVIRIIISKNYTNSILNGRLNVKKNNIGYFLLLFSVIGCALGVLTKHIQFAMYNPYIEATIQQVVVCEEYSNAHISFNLNKTNDSNAQIYNVSIRGYYNDELLIKTEYFNLYNNEQLCFQITMYADEQYKALKKIGFDNFTYYMVIQEATFDIGNITMYLRPYITKIS